MAEAKIDKSGDLPDGCTGIEIPGHESLAVHI